jgi:hypothetical protein
MKSRLLTILSFLVMTFITQAQVNSVAIIGSGTPGGWDAETPMVLVDDSLQLYGVTINLTANEVKFRANGAWDINWGDTGFPIGTGVQGGPNIPIAVAGEYNVLFSALTGVYYFVYESPIGILGDATPTGWDEDINLFPSATDTNAYFITLPLVQGKAKFRQDDAWDIAWGDGGFPAGIGNVEPGSANINVPEAGNYTVTFVLSTGEYNFQLNVANISENSANMNLSVYPNPSNESVNFRFGASTEATITLFDLTGKEVSSKTETAQTINVNTENLNEGIYMYQVKVGNEITTGKISKK